MERFYVKAGSVNAVRRAMRRAPGGAKVVGRHDRDTIECTHTMTARSLTRHWPTLVSRLANAGLTVVERPGSRTGPEERPDDGAAPGGERPA